MLSEDRASADEEAEALARIRACFRADTLDRLLGFELVEGGAGYAVVRATVGKEHLNFYGSAHGGFVFALADAAFSFACNSDGVKALAVNAFVSFLKAAHPGEILTATAREVSRSTKLGSYQVEVRRGEREVIATFTGTAYRSSQPGRPADP